jgi:uncharacterized protein YraI
MTRARLLALGIGLGLVVPALLSAQTAFTNRTVHLRAGPDREYPVVTTVSPGAPVEVAGCISDYSWCDVTVGPDRGWAYASGLVYPYEDQRLAIFSAGPYMGLPVVAYDPGIYWDTYYRGRPWYGRRSYWVGRPLAFHRAIIVRPGMRPPGFHPGHPGVVHQERRTERRVENHNEHQAERRTEDRHATEHRATEHKAPEHKSKDRH